MSKEPTIYCAEILEFMLKYVVMLPLTLTMDSKNKWLRIVGVLAEFAWFFPGGLVFFFSSVPLLLGVLFESTWKERTP